MAFSRAFDGAIVKRHNILELGPEASISQSILVVTDSPVKVEEKYMATGPHLLCLVLMLAGSARADVYLHNPRGSNNKLNEVRCTALTFPSAGFCRGARGKHCSCLT